MYPTKKVCGFSLSSSLPFNGSHIGIDPLLGKHAGQNVCDNPILINKIGGRCAENVVAAAYSAICIHEEGVFQAILGNKVFYGRMTLLNTHGKNNKAIVLVLIVGRPQRGGAGVTSRSPGVHEHHCHRLAAIFT